jgi:hypothetical protein
MSFSQLRSQISSDLVKIQSIQDYKRVYLSSDVMQSIDQLNKKFVEHLFQDLINKELDVNIRTYLKERDAYQIANDFALECIEPAFYKTNIHGARIKDWTSSALKCFDVFLIKLINQYLNEKIRKSSSKPKESDVYTHLINKGEHYYEIGMAFKTIYQTRNDFTHIQYETKDGYRHLKKWSRSKYDMSRDLILEQFEKGLNALIKEIKTYGI